MSLRMCRLFPVTSAAFGSVTGPRARILLSYENVTLIAHVAGSQIPIDNCALIRGKQDNTTDEDRFEDGYFFAGVTQLYVKR